MYKIYMLCVFSLHTTLVPSTYCTLILLTGTAKSAMIEHDYKINATIGLFSQNIHSDH